MILSSDGSAIQFCPVAFKIPRPHFNFRLPVFSPRRRAAVMAASPPRPRAPSCACSGSRSARSAASTACTRRASPRCVSWGAWWACCCPRRPSCRACSGRGAPRSASACASSPRRTARSGGRRRGTGRASPRSASGRARSGSPPAKRTCCSRCSGRASRRSGCAGGSSGCWGGRSSSLEEGTIDFFVGRLGWMKSAFSEMLGFRGRGRICVDSLRCDYLFEFVHPVLTRSSVNSDHVTDSDAILVQMRFISAISS